MKYYLPVVAALLVPAAAIAVPLVNFNDTWRYRKGTSAPQTNWKTVADDSLNASWLSGPGWIGYGDGSGANAAGTTLTDMEGSYRTITIRKTFTVPAGTLLTDEIVLQTDFDDGFIAWIDGTQADNLGMTAEMAFNNTSTTVSSHECSFGDNSPGAVRTTVLGAVGAKATPGTHVLAIQLANTTVGSSDAVLKVNLFTQTPTPPLPLHWTLADSPIVLTSTFSVAANQELVIDPGVEVRCHGGGDAISCAGKITASGTAAQRIHFVRNAAGTGWRRILMTGTPECVFSYCDFDGSRTSGTLRPSGSSSVNPLITLDHCRWQNTDVQMVEMTWSSCTITNCEFDSIGSQELIHFSNMPATGHALIKNCLFGIPGVPPTSGYNDIVDFTGGNRPGPIVQFIGNIFLASVDDCFDMDGTDAHIEGNIFLNVKKDANRDSSSNPITTGADGNNRSELVICRNVFYNCEHMFMEKDYGTGLLQNNTLVHLATNPFSNNTDPDGNEASGIIMFGEPWRNTFPYGDGAIFEGNIVTDIDAAITDVWPILPSASAETGFFFPRRQNCITGFLQPGTGNLAANPQLVSIAGVDQTNIRTKFALQPGSPCLGTGPNGLDMGALVPPGASISGQPAGTTTATGATIAVAGPGIWAYQWRLDGGAWSAEVSLVPASIWAGGQFTGTMLDNPVPIVLTNLSDGPHTLEVRGKNSAAFWQDTPYATATWTVQGTAPADTDSDGIPDTWETANGLDPNDNADAAKDKDGDGATNLDEYIAGTDPQNRASLLRAAHTFQANGSADITFDAVAGKSYKVQASADLTGNSWTTITTLPVQATSGPVTVNDPTAVAASRRFYRVITP